jgi:uncharacterized membrane protein YbhN (UPF0104 family)
MPEKDDKLTTAGFEKPMFGHAQHYYSELMRMITILFVGVLALMTFLLTVGFQRPHADFSYALYTTIIALGLNFLAFVVAQVFFLDVMGQKKAELATEDKKDKEDKKEGKSKLEKAKARLRVMRIIQQVLFVIAVASVVWLALATAHFFFTIPTSTSAAGGQ